MDEIQKKETCIGSHVCERANRPGTDFAGARLPSVPPSPSASTYPSLDRLLGSMTADLIIIINDHKALGDSHDSKI